MTAARASAPAKVNLTLHVTGQRPEGYHDLDSLVVFADVCDQLSVVAASDLSVRVSGPFATGVPTDHSNLVLRAAQALRQARGVRDGADISLEKVLPHAAGLGSGSADAAAALDLLADFWNVKPLPGTAPEVVALGADVPVCLRGPAPCRMSGIGDVLSPLPALPDCALVLVNPRVPVPTADVFRLLQIKSNPAMTPIPDKFDFDGFADWLSQQRNDLLEPACSIAPQIATALERLRRIPAVRVAGLSGSGATCWGLVRDMAQARQAARAVQVSEMSWWVAPAQVL
jgi:4-diphosphocytidyl-2-C-methyl-D-erythritol kinase